MGPSSGPREIRLSTTPDKADLDALELGDIVWLDGLIYTAREGVYTVSYTHLRAHETV